MIMNLTQYAQLGAMKKTVKLFSFVLETLIWQGGEITKFTVISHIKCFLAKNYKDSSKITEKDFSCMKKNNKKASR